MPGVNYGSPRDKQYRRAIFAQQHDLSRRVPNLLTTPTANTTQGQEALPPGHFERYRAERAAIPMRAMDYTQIRQVPNNLLTSPTANTTPGRGVEMGQPDWRRIRQIRYQTFVATNSQFWLNKDTALYLLTSPLPSAATDDSTVEQPDYLFNHIKARQGRYAALRAPPDGWQNVLSTLLASAPPETQPDGKRYFPDSARNIPAERKRQQAINALVSGDPQTWLTTPPPPDGGRYYPDTIPGPLRSRPAEDVSDNLLGTLLAPSAPEAIPDGKQEYPDDVRDRTRAGRYTALLALTQGDPQTWLTTPPPPDGKLLLPERVPGARRRNPADDTSVNLQGTLYVVPPEVIPAGKQQLPDDVRNRNLARRYASVFAPANGDAQTWLTTPPPPPGKTEQPADTRDRTRAGRYRALLSQPEVWQNPFGTTLVPPPVTRWILGRARYTTVVPGRARYTTLVRGAARYTLRILGRARMESEQ